MAAALAHSLDAGRMDADGRKGRRRYKKETNSTRSSGEGGREGGRLLVHSETRYLVEKEETGAGGKGGSPGTTIMFFCRNW